MSPSKVMFLVPKDMAINRFECGHLPAAPHPRAVHSPTCLEDSSRLTHIPLRRCVILLFHAPPLVTVPGSATSFYDFRLPLVGLLFQVCRQRGQNLGDLDSPQSLGGNGRPMSPSLQVPRLSLLCFRFLVPKLITVIKKKLF